jgi:hypothetical protein
MPSDIRNICLIDISHTIATEFVKAGYLVLRIQATPQPFFDLPAALDKHDFIPDLVLQNEHIGARSLLTGLDQLDCPLMFWCVDPHLNAHWHSAYARLFDLTGSTQRAWIPKIRQQGASDVRWLPWYGRDMARTAWDKRPHGLTFVGRVTKQRPARKWMIEILKDKGAPFNPAIRQDLTHSAMMQLYQESKIIPNESIFGEINFRLFEAASCGCMALCQDLGKEQEELFEPGREFATYSNVADFGEKLSLYLKNDRLTQTMGRAAHARIQADHLPVHRMKRIVEYARSATKSRATGTDAAKWTTLAACAMWEADVLHIPSADLLKRLNGLPQDADLTAATLRIQAMTGSLRVLEDYINTILGNNLHADSPALNLAGSMASLHVNHWDGAKAFWYRHLKTTNARETSPPRDAKELLTLWAKNLKQRDQLIRAGFPFDATRHLPATAAECLMAVLESEPEDLPTLRLLDTILRPIPGLELLRMGFLSILTLHERNDWRLAFEIALANLKSYRLKSGLEELQLARDMARKQGQETVFDKALKTRDLSGMLSGMIDQ